MARSKTFQFIHPSSDSMMITNRPPQLTQFHLSLFHFHSPFFYSYSLELVEALWWCWTACEESTRVVGLFVSLSKAKPKSAHKKNSIFNVINIVVVTRELVGNARREVENFLSEKWSSVNSPIYARLFFNIFPNNLFFRSHNDDVNDDHDELSGIHQPIRTNVKRESWNIRDILPLSMGQCNVK